MEISQAQEIVKLLSEGIDPLTGEWFDEESHYRHPKILSAITTLVKRLDGYESRRKNQDVMETQQRNLAQGFPRNAGLSWEDEDQKDLQIHFRSGSPVSVLAQKFGRTRSSILAELYRQKLVSLDQAREQLVYR